jgi:hypothetical protein
MRPSVSVTTAPSKSVLTLTLSRAPRRQVNTDDGRDGSTAVLAGRFDSFNGNNTDGPFGKRLPLTADDVPSLELPTFVVWVCVDRDNTIGVPPVKNVQN